jgi:hypothetical protein
MVVLPKECHLVSVAAPRTSATLKCLPANARRPAETTLGKPAGQEIYGRPNAVASLELQVQVRRFDDKYSAAQRKRTKTITNPLVR